MRSCRQIYDVFKAALRDFPGGPGVKTLLPLKGAQVPSLIREVRSHMPCRMAKKQTNKQTNKKSKQRLRKVNCAILIIIANIY